MGLAPVLGGDLDRGFVGVFFCHFFCGACFWFSPCGVGAWAVLMRTRRAAGTCCGSALRALCRSQQAPATRLLGVELTAGFSAAHIVRQTDQKIYLLLLTFG